MIQESWSTESSASSRSSKKVDCDYSYSRKASTSDSDVIAGGNADKGTLPRYKLAVKKVCRTILVHSPRLPSKDKALIEFKASQS